MSYRFFSLKFLTISLCLVGLFNISSLRTADAAGSVAMQAASLMKLAPQAYNMGMRNGNADKWNQYMEHSRIAIMSTKSANHFGGFIDFIHDDMKI